jgi:hypothetical protein
VKRSLAVRAGVKASLACAVALSRVAAILAAGGVGLEARIGARRFALVDVLLAPAEFTPESLRAHAEVIISRNGRVGAGLGALAAVLALVFQQTLVNVHVAVVSLVAILASTEVRTNLIGASAAVLAGRALTV